MVLKQVNELTHWRVAEYEKSQEESHLAVPSERNMGQQLQCRTPWPHGVVRPLCSTLQEEELGRVGPMGKGQTPEGLSWWSHLGDSRDDQQTQPQEGGTGDA